MQQPRDFSLYGAVDLGARQVAAQRRQQAADKAASGDGTTSVSVIEVTEETFNTDVVARSRTTPVIVDLWAEWCGPCKQLSPVLERLAADADGAWILAKVDVDANPQLSAALQVQSIPMVVAVIGGQLVDGFLGALPEAQVRQWLSQVLAVAEKLGVQSNGAADAADASEQATPAGSGEADELPPGYAEARDAMDRGDLDGAAAALEKALATSPADEMAKSWLAQVNLVRRVNSYDQAAVRRTAAEHPDDLDAQLQVADIDVATGRVEDGFDRLLGVVRRTAGEDKERARAHLVGLFELFPPRDPQVTRARATLSSLLF
jgi:putative thioredoxin